MIEILAFLSIFWPPIIGTILISFMFWFITRPDSPEVKLARQKADYERAHAYKPEDDKHV